MMQLNKLTLSLLLSLICSNSFAGDKEIKELQQSVNELKIMMQAVLAENQQIKEKAIYTRINALCGGINKQWDYGKAYKITSNKSCSKLCKEQKEDTKGCAGFISYSHADGRYAQHDCSPVGDEYYVENIYNYCCCK